MRRPIGLDRHDICAAGERRAGALAVRLGYSAEKEKGVNIANARTTN